MAHHDLVQSLQRGLQIMEILSEAEDGLRLKSLADRLGLKQPTAHNLLRTLCAEGFVSRKGQNLYTLGSRVEELAARRQSRALRRRVEEALRMLTREIPDAILSFAEPVAGDVHIRLRVSPDLPGRIQRPALRLLPLYTSASGLAMLAFCPAAERDLFFARHALLEEGARLWGGETELKSALDRIREQGFAFHPDAGPEHLIMAAPVWEGEEALAGTLGMNISPTGHRLTKAKRERLIALLTETADRVSQSTAEPVSG